ncbi:type II toxin-antitoxin system ParD family antitoxin [Pokkaliibacter plantistimulans]
MTKTTSITLGDHFDDYVVSQSRNGRYGLAC